MNVHTALILLSALFAAGALVVLAIGLRGRVRFTPPRCVACAYDLRTINLSALANATCPECGATLADPRAITFGERESRRGMILLGLAMLVLGGASAAVWSTMSAQPAPTPPRVVPLPGMRVRSIPVVPPTPQVLPQATPDTLLTRLKQNPNDRDAWNEIRTRIEDGSISSADLNSVVGIICDSVGSTENPTRNGLFGNLEFALRSPIVHERLNAASLQKYYEATTAIPRIISRRRAKQSSVRFLWMYSPNYSALKGSQICISLRQVKSDDGKIVFSTSPPFDCTIYDQERCSKPTVFSAVGDYQTMHGPFSPGERTLEFTFDFGVVAEGAIFHGPNGKPGTKEQWPHPICVWQRVVRHTFTIVPDSEPILDAITDSSKDPFKTFDFGIQDAIVREIGTDRKQIAIRWKANQAPSIPLSYRIAVNVGGSSIDFGQLGGVDPRVRNFEEWHRVLPAKALSDSINSIDIHFIPDPRVATGSIECEQYWNVPHEITGLKLQREDLAQR